MREQYACNVNCPHFYSQFNNCVFFLDLSTGMCDTISYNSNIKNFCPYADKNIMLGEYRVEDDYTTEKGGSE